MAPLLSVESLVTGYGRRPVIHEVSLKLEAGGTLAVLGANGAGKTTLTKALAGIQRCWSGSVFFDGTDISAAPAEERAVLGVTLAPEGRGIFTSLSIQENLEVGAASLLRRLGRRRYRAMVASGLERAYAMFPVLSARRRSSASALSGGQQQMLAIARALMAEPRLLILDEPCLGLAPKLAGEVYSALRELRAQGQSMIVVEESTKRALGFADHACILRLGRSVLEGGAEEMRTHAALSAAYFGEAQIGERRETVQEDT